MSKTESEKIERLSVVHLVNGTDALAGDNAHHETFGFYIAAGKFNSLAARCERAEAELAQMKAERDQLGEICAERFQSLAAERAKVATLNASKLAEDLSFAQRTISTYETIAESMANSCRSYVTEYSISVPPGQNILDLVISDARRSRAGLAAERAKVEALSEFARAFGEYLDERDEMDDVTLMLRFGRAADLHRDLRARGAIE